MYMVYTVVIVSYQTTGDYDMKSAIVVIAVVATAASTLGPILAEILRALTH